MAETVRPSQAVTWGELKAALEAWGLADEEMLCGVRFNAPYRLEDLKIRRTAYGIQLMLVGRLWSPLYAHDEPQWEALPAPHGPTPEG